MNEMKSKRGFLLLVSACLISGASLGHGAAYTPAGHYDLNVTFTNGVGWVFNWYNFDNQDRVPTKAIDIGVTEAARTAIPPSGYAALGGAPDDPVWIIPQTLTPDVIYLGYRTQDAEQSEFDALFGTPFIGLKVTNVRGSGPDRGGYFTGYQTGLGDPVFHYTTADGLDNSDVVAPIPLTAHAHYNWAFTQPGEYQVTFEAEGTHRTGVATNGNGTFTFFVPGGMTNLHVLDSGHVSHMLGFVSNTLEMSIRSDIDGIAGAWGNKSRAPEEALIYAKASDIALTVPGSGFEFLGSPGETIWAFPQSNDPNTVFMGLTAHGATNGALLNDVLELRLVGVDGPTNGHFSFFQVDALGAAKLYMNSGDGVDPAVDRHAFGHTGHDHYFWGFTKTGLYSVSFQLAATNSSGTPITSRVYETQFGIGVLPGFRDDDGNGIDDHWEARHGFTTPADPTADLDGDNKSNLNEYLFDTDPRVADTNAPLFRVTTNSLSSVSMEIDTLEGREYRLMYSDDLRTWKPGSERILGQRTRLPFLDDGNGLIQGAPTNRFYRLDVSSPR